MINRNSIISPQGYRYHLSIFESTDEYLNFSSNPWWVGDNEGIIFIYNKPASEESITYYDITYPRYSTGDRQKFDPARIVTECEGNETTYHRYPSGDLEKEGTPMYSWHGDGSIQWTDTTNPTTSTHVWYFDGDTWTDYTAEYSMVIISFTPQGESVNAYCWSQGEGYTEAYTLTATPTTSDNIWYVDEYGIWTEGFGITSYNPAVVEHFAIVGVDGNDTTESINWLANLGYPVEIDVFLLEFSATNGSVDKSYFVGKTGDTVTVTVTPDEGYTFTSWDDESTDNPRTFTVGDEDAEYVATCSA